MSKLTLLSTSIALILSPLSAIANTTDSPTEPTVALDDVVITATRSPTKIQNTLAQTIVLTEQDLQRHQGQSVLDVLKTQVGISHYTNGGMGKVSNLYLRGYDSKSILVLIDGIRYASLSTGTPALSLLPSDHIERIEILHGASGSSIYGADAVGGVIQIFTKKGSTNGNTISATLGAGSHSHLNYGASASLKNDDTYLTLSASHNKTDGFNAIVSPQNPTQADDDGFESRNVSLAFGHRLHDNFKLDGSVLYAKSFNDYDNLYSSESQIYGEQKNGSAQLSGTWQYHNDGTLTLQYGQSADRSKNFTGQTVSGTFDSRQTQYGLIVNHTLPVGKIIAGLEKQKQNLDSSSTYLQNTRDTDSIFAGYQLNQNNIDGQVFVRYDDNSQYGSKTTYNTGLAYHFNPSLRAGANFAKGFRAPSFNEAYDAASGNPNLNPESSNNYEIFGEYTTNQSRTRLTAYQNKVDNLISWVMTNPITWAGQNQNINKSQITGASLTSDWEINNYLFGLSYDYQKSINKSIGTEYNNHLPIRPKNKGLIYAGLRHNDFDVRAEYQYVGDYFYDTANTNKVDSYSLVNLSGNYQLNRNIRLTGRINNVFDKEYATAKGYGTTYGEDGRNFFGAVTFSY